MINRCSSFVLGSFRITLANNEELAAPLENKDERSYL
jgi:hypothetical protein